MRWPFARASRSRKHLADEAELARLRDAISAVKRNGTVVDQAIARTDIPAGREGVGANGHSHDLQDTVAASNSAGNGSGGNGRGIARSSDSPKPDQPVSGNGHGIYPASKQRP